MYSACVGPCLKARVRNFFNLYAQKGNKGRTKFSDQLACRVMRPGEDSGMNNADNMFDGDEDHGFVVRKTKTQYHVKGVEDIPLNKRELIIFLSRNGVSVEETGLMFTYFEMDRANEAHFGVLGEFLFATNYNP